MSVNIRYPNITGFTDKEQITQIRSYLHQLVEQLNYALSTIGAEGTGQATYDVQGGNVSYYELQSMIVQEIQKLDRQFEQLSTKLESEVDSYVDEAFAGTVAEAVNEALPEVLTEALPQAISDNLGLVVQEGMLCATYTEVANE